MGQSHVAEEARAEPSERVESSARWASPISEAPEEVTDASLKGTDRGLEMPAEPPTTIELLSDKEIEAMTPLLWMMLSLSPCMGLRWWELLKILRLQTT